MRKPIVFFKTILCAVMVVCFAAASAQDAKYYIDKADEFYNNANYDLAITNYTKAISIDPGIAYAYNGRGMSYGNKTQVDLAIQDFNKAISLDPNYSLAYANRGFAFSQKNQPDLAIQDFTKAINLDPNNAWAYSNRGYAYSAKNLLDLAIQDHTKVINLNPDYPTAYVDRGIVFGNKNQVDFAIQDFSKAISLDTENPIAYGYRGFAYSQKNVFDLALHDLTKAIELNPDYIWAYTKRGYAYSGKNQFDLAIQDFTTAINLNPNVPNAYVDRAVAYGKNYQVDLAIQDYNTTLSIDPNYTWAYANRGFAYAQKKQFDLAIQDYTTAINLDLNFSFAYGNRGYAYSQKNLFDLALQDYNKAIRLDTTNSWTYGSRGWAYLRKNQFELAILDYTKAINMGNTIAPNYNNRGLCYNSLGKYELAIQDYKTCLAKEPNNSLTYINIIAPLVRMQRIPEAKSYYDQYKQRKFSSFLESERYKFYKYFITAVTQVSDGMMEEALANLELASKEYGTEIKEETKRTYIDILFLKGYILEKINRDEEAKGIYEQSLVIDTRQPDLAEALLRLQQKQAATRSIDNTGPEIVLINPTPSRGFEIVADNVKTQIIGRAKDVAGIATIKINGTPVEKIEDDGLFIVNLLLKSGANSLEIMATDKQNNTASKTFVLNGTGIANNTEPKPDQLIATNGTPKYFAILIAEKDYDDDAIPDLQNPVKDAKELKAILESKYTFNPANIDTLYNRSREDIMQAIVQRCNTLTENDNLVIFYAGHGIGEKDKFGDVDGYWIPSSARKGLNASYISSDDINKAIKRSNAKHILIIADACFSGAFTRELPPDASKLIAKQYAVPSRKVMASGNLEPVPDNSKLLFFLKQSLTDNKEKYITAKDLWDGMYKKIINNTDNLPQYAAIKNVGDEGGEFIFIKK